MPRETSSLKDILQIIIFLVITGSFITGYVAYPLNRTVAFFARSNSDSFNPDSLPPNDPSLFVKENVIVDTFRLETDGLTTISAIYLSPHLENSKPIQGTVLLAHDERNDRGSMLPIAGFLIDSGYSVVVYDQRASGLSGGKYHGDGFFEANDMAEIIPWLDIRNRINHPLVAVGFSLGGDAAIIASRSESRIDGIIAIEPYLSTDRRLSILEKEHASIPVPFLSSVLWWWYDLRSGYESRYTTVDDIEPVASPTLILANQDSQNSEEFVRLAELSESELLMYKEKPESENGLLSEILEFTRKLAVSDSSITIR